MFEKMKEMQSTTHLFFGHDHLNILDIEYQGIRFFYCLKTGICSYYDADRIGTTLVTIFSDPYGTDEVDIRVEFNNH